MYEEIRRQITLNEAYYPTMLSWGDLSHPDGIGLEILDNNYEPIEDKDLINDIYENYFDWNTFYNDVGKEFVDYVFKYNKHVKVEFLKADGDTCEVILITNLEDLLEYISEHGYDNNYSDESNSILKVLDNIAQSEADRNDICILDLLEDIMGNHNVSEWINEKGLKLINEWNKLKN